MSCRKRFPAGRYARPEGGWGCPRAAARWFDRVADDLSSMAAGIKELAVMAHNDGSPGHTFGGMIRDLFDGQSLFVLQRVLDAAAGVADEFHPGNRVMPDDPYPPRAAAEPDPWGDPDLHPPPWLRPGGLSLSPHDDAPPPPEPWPPPGWTYLGLVPNEYGVPCPTWDTGEDEPAAPANGGAR